MSSNPGYVYVAINGYMPDLVKIGCTSKNPHVRASELSTPTGVPGGYDIVGYLFSPHYKEIEKLLHLQLMDDWWVGKEFFGMSPYEALSALANYGFVCSLLANGVFKK